MPLHHTPVISKVPLPFSDHMQMPHARGVQEVPTGHPKDAPINYTDCPDASDVPIRFFWARSDSESFHFEHQLKQSHDRILLLTHLKNEQKKTALGCPLFFYLTLTLLWFDKPKLFVWEYKETGTSICESRRKQFW